MADFHFVITTDAEHKAALQQLERLWNASLGEPPSEELQALIDAVIAYENKRWVNEPVPPSPFD